MPLKPILMEAFKVRMDQIEGPSCLESDCFDISARMPEGATKDQLPALLQALLIERFKLAARKETRSRPGYALVVDKEATGRHRPDRSHRADTHRELTCPAQKQSTALYIPADDFACR